MGALAPDKFIQDVEAELQGGQWNLMKHPLVDKVTKGELTRNQLKGWVVQTYLPVSDHFLRLVAALYASCPSADLRESIWENLLEEMTGSISKSMSHPQLLIKLAKALGASEDEIKTVEPVPETKEYLDWLEKLRHLSFIEGVGGIMFGGEAQIIGAQEVISKALKDNYGLTDDDTMFFDIHVDIDKEHGDVGKTIIERFARDEEVQDKVRQAALTTAIKTYKFFDSYQRF
jgi:pyrroloquinoline quinone (PQQ) biosynthesis protein C